MSVEEQRLQEMRILVAAKETLSEKEERFERWRNTVGLFVGPLLALVVYAIPMPSLSDKAHVLAAIITLIAVWWITEPIPIPMSAVSGGRPLRNSRRCRCQTGICALRGPDHLSLSGQLYTRRGHGNPWAG